MKYTYKQDVEHSEDAIAVIGLGCRFPGAVDQYRFWENLCAGSTGITFFSEEALLEQGVPRSLLLDPNYVRVGYILENVFDFDSDFFGYTGLETEFIDPQQRIFLELCWEALEDAGYPPFEGGIPGGNVGVFAGTRMSGYLQHAFSSLSQGKNTAAFQALIGNDKDYLCSRIAYKLNLHGPCVSVQTACSSSLVAVHQACENLRCGCCDVALAGGVAVSLPQRTGYLYQEGMILSPDGYCRAFDAHAQGTAFSSGAGVVVLKRLDDALADHDLIYAVLLGSSVNNDGAGRVGFTAPGLSGQTAVIREALGVAGVRAREIGYVEAHGTGTAIGDPLEIEALTAAFRCSTNDTGFCPIGSVKTNIGHADAAAGIAGLIKTILALYHKKIPPSLHFKTPNPSIDFAGSPFFVQQEGGIWEEKGYPRTAGVSSFGIGGTNAHVVLRESPVHLEKKGVNGSGGYLFALSSKNETMLRESVQRFHTALHTNAYELEDVCFTSCVSRGDGASRLAMIVHSMEDLQKKLSTWTEAHDGTRLYHGQVEEKSIRAAGRDSFQAAALFNDRGLSDDELDAYAKRYVEGARIHARETARADGPVRLHLPTTPFQRRPYRADIDVVSQPCLTTGHPLVSHTTRMPDGLLCFEVVLEGDDLAILRDHVLFGSRIAPASLFFELARYAGREVYQTGVRVTAMRIEAPLFLEADQLELRIRITEDAAQKQHGHIKIFSLQERAWQLHLTAELKPQEKSRTKAVDPVALQAEMEPVPLERFYQAFSDLGVTYGRYFRNTTGVWRANGRSLSLTRGPRPAVSAGYGWHPALLDSCLQTVLAAFPATETSEGSTFIPVGCAEMVLADHAPDILSTVATWNEKTQADTFTFDLTLHGEDGRLAGWIHGLQMRHVVREHIARSVRLQEDRHGWWYRNTWVEDTHKPSPPVDDTQVILIAADAWLQTGLAPHCRKLAIPMTCCQGLQDLSPLVPEEGPRLHIVQCGGLGRDANSSWDEAWQIHFFDILALVRWVLDNGLQSRTRITIVTDKAQQIEDMYPENPRQSLVWGMCRGIWLEHPELDFQVIDIDVDHADPTMIAEELCGNPSTGAVALRGNRRFRIQLEEIQDEALHIETASMLSAPKPGLENLAFMPFPRTTPSTGEVEVEIVAAGLNFRDVMMAMGMYPGENTPLGSEAAGIIVRVGDGVAGFAPGDRVVVSTFGCLATSITTPVSKVKKIPASLSFHQAAALPVVYITAWYVLHHLAGVQAGQSVLIHSASGGVGLAALSILRAAHAVIYATAGNPEKRAYLEQQGCVLVSDSRSVRFKADILQQTSGRGVDIVLNFLTGALRDATLDILAPNGVFLEIGKTGIWTTEEVAKKRPDVAYYPVDLVDLGREQPALLEKISTQVIESCVKGRFDLLPVEIFPWNQAADAFKRMLAARHMGKIVLLREVIDDGNSTELITGGFGDMGMALAEWRFQRGVRHFVLVGRNVPNADKKRRLERLRSQGGTVMEWYGDVGRFPDMQALFTEMEQSCPPLRRVYHLAGCVEDAMVEHLDEASCREVLRPKTAGAWNLHLLTAERPLERFVLFSSTASALGSVGQVNYAAANSFLDALAAHRRGKGLPALSVNWGPFSGGGMAERAGITQVLSSFGIRPFSMEQGFLLLEALLSKETGANVIAADIDWEILKNIFRHTPVATTWSRLKEPQPGEDGQHPGNAFHKELRAASVEERTQKLTAFLTNKVTTLLKIQQEDIDATANLLQLGVDSLIALDLFQRIEKETGIRVEQRALFDHPTIAALAGKFAQAVDEEEAVVDDVLPHIVPDQESRYQPFPLTDMQQAYWIGRTNALDLGGVSCHVYLEIDGNGIDASRYEKAWRRTLQCHDMLRMGIRRDGMQQIQPTEEEIPLEIHDIRSMSADRVEAFLLELRRTMSHELLPAEGPLVKIGLTHMPEGRCRLHIGLDLLVADLLSMNILMRDLVSFYHTPDMEKEPCLLSFRDYVLALQKLRSSRTWLADREYWRNKVGDLPPAPALPILSPPEGKTIFERKTFQLGNSQWQHLQQMANQHTLTPAGLLLAVYAEVLAAWSNSSRFTINVTLFQRVPMHGDINKVVGDFTTMTLVALDHDPERTFVERARNVQEQLWNDREHSLYSGVEVVRDWTRKTGGKTGRIIPVVFTSTLGLGEKNETHPDLSSFGEVVYTITQTPQVWIDFQVREIRGKLDLNWDYAAGLFPEGMIDDMFFAFTRIMTVLAQEKRQWRKTGFPMLPPHQLAVRRQVNATFAQQDDATLFELFLQSVRHRSESPAVIDHQGTWSYGKLAQQAGNSTRALLEAGFPAGQTVAIVTDRGRDEIAAVLAILGAGGAYLPIDASMPEKRREVILARAAVHYILTTASYAESLAGDGRKVIAVDMLEDGPIPPPVRVSSGELAYIIYTSGSTGLPKGVMITHRSAVNTILAINTLFEVTASDRVLALSRLSFDLSVWDMFGMFAAGGCIVLPHHEHDRDPQHWSQLMARHGVSVWNSVPALLHMLMDSSEWSRIPSFKGLRLIMLSGDWIPVALADKVRTLISPAHFIALGGATEASIWSNYYRIHQVEKNWKSIPYGKPLPNQFFYVLDHAFRDCPDWVAGTLHIGGAGLSTGYQGDPERTAAQFFNHPETGEPLYMTGDLGRYLPDGNIEFLGRDDFQVKMNGYRIELGEIETHLSEHPGVRQCVVIARKGVGEGKRLEACIVREPTQPPLEGRQAQQWLEERLPAYMVPASIHFLDELPLNASGKVDRKQLLEISNAAPVSDVPENPPETELEKMIAEVLESVLHHNTIGCDSRFFELGITSLDLIGIQGTLQRKLGYELPVIALLEHTTIRQLAAYLADTRPAATPAVVQRGQDRASRRKRRRSSADTPL